MIEHIEKSPWKSKKHRAYILADLTWTIIILVSIIGLYVLVDKEVLAGVDLVDAIKAFSSVLIVMSIAKLIMQGTYIGGQAWVDAQSRVAMFAAGIKMNGGGSLTTVLQSMFAEAEPTPGNDSDSDEPGETGSS